MLTDLLAVTPQWLKLKLLQILGVDPQAYCEWVGIHCWCDGSNHYDEQLDAA